MSKDRLRAEIDAKRAKIAEMREARNHRAAQLASSTTSGAASPALTVSQNSREGAKAHAPVLKAGCERPGRFFAGVAHTC